MSDLEFDLSSSLKVKSNCAAGLPIYFLLVPNSSYISISHRFGVIATQKFFSYLLSGLGSFSAFPVFDNLVPTFDLNIQGSLYC